MEVEGLWGSGPRARDLAFRIQGFGFKMGGGGGVIAEALNPKP